MKEQKYHVIDATKEDSTAILEVTNEAFMADAFYKKPKYSLRFSSERVAKTFDAKDQYFLVAKRASDQTIVGSIHLEVHKDASNTVTGHFSALSVPPKNGKQGIGKQLIQAAEEKVRGFAKELQTTETRPVKAKMEMDVVNVRTDLFPWYEKQFYRQTDFLPNDCWFDELISEEYHKKVYLIRMMKDLVI
jgi:predicted N-acetyltransferase YhbS